jgi:hypothetical protein
VDALTQLPIERGQLNKQGTEPIPNPSAIELRPHYNEQEAHDLYAVAVVLQTNTKMAAPAGGVDKDGLELEYPLLTVSVPATNSGTVTLLSSGQTGVGQGFVFAASSQAYIQLRHVRIRSLRFLGTTADVVYLAA